MKFALCLISLLWLGSAQAKLGDTRIEKTPGRIKIELDINMGHGDMVDVLAVVDNSGSMNSHQMNLKNHAQSLINQFTSAGLDYHIGIITSDEHENGRLIRGTFVTPASPNPADQLASLFQVGTNGSATEMIFDPIVAALSEPNLSGANKGFFRPDAGLALVVLTDAEDQSVVNSPDQFVNFIKNVKPNGLVTMQGIIVPTGVSNCPRDQESPARIESAIAQLGGQAYSLCAANYSENIVQIGNSIASVASGINKGLPADQIPAIQLPSAPDYKSIKVTYGSQTLIAGNIQYGWVYDAQTNEVRVGDKVKWSYQPLGTPLTITYVPADWAK